MPVINRIADFQAEMAAWRHDLHAHPETAFEEQRTADTVARLLTSFGIEVERGVARTGVIGTLRGSSPGGRAIALRADMDALPIEEKNGFAHASRHHGRMHACGHDGHTAMLLGAAKYLAETRNFAGTVHFIFQPAEENEGGARLMVEEGVLERYPVEAVYGMHNWPGLPAGQFAIRPGPMMAAFDIFEITVTGRGAHAAMPHLGIDPIVAAAQIVNGLQTIASRNIDPLRRRGRQRHADPRRRHLERDPRQRGAARHHPLVRPGGARCARTGDPPRRRRAPAPRSAPAWSCATSGATRPTVNSAAETETRRRHRRRRWSATTRCAATCCRAWGPRISPAFSKRSPAPISGSATAPRADQAMLHNPHYDFNDEILALGASYWARLAETMLEKPWVEATAGQRRIVVRRSRRCCRASPNRLQAITVRKIISPG